MVRFEMEESCRFPLPSAFLLKNVLVRYCPPETWNLRRGFSTNSTLGWLYDEILGCLFSFEKLWRLEKLIMKWKGTSYTSVRYPYHGYHGLFNCDFPFISIFCFVRCFQWDHCDGAFLLDLLPSTPPSTISLYVLSFLLVIWPKYC